MLRCPPCRIPMQEARQAELRVSRCERCRGHALSVPVLRRLLREDAWGSVWGHLRRLVRKSQRVCPGCNRWMLVSDRLPALGDMAVDWCRSCRLVWLDPSELDRMPRRPPPPEEEPLSAAAGAALALFEADSLASRRAMEVWIEAGRLAMQRCAPGIGGFSGFF